MGKILKIFSFFFCQIPLSFFFPSPHKNICYLPYKNLQVQKGTSFHISKKHFIIFLTIFCYARNGFLLSYSFPLRIPAFIIKEIFSKISVSKKYFQKITSHKHRIYFYYYFVLLFLYYL